MVLHSTNKFPIFPVLQEQVEGCDVDIFQIKANKKMAKKNSITYIDGLIDWNANQIRCKLPIENITLESFPL